MNENAKQAKNIFEQILFGIEATNNNIVALSQDIQEMFAKMDEIHKIFTSEPIIPGAETKETIGDDI